MFKCNNCGSTDIAVEAIVMQRDDGVLEVTGTCDDGHTCNVCESNDIGWDDPESETPPDANGYHVTKDSDGWWHVARKGRRLHSTTIWENLYVMRDEAIKEAARRSAVQS